MYNAELSDFHNFSYTSACYVNFMENFTKPETLKGKADRSVCLSLGPLEAFDTLKILPQNSRHSFKTQVIISNIYREKT